MDWNVWNPDHIAKGPPHPSEMENGRAIFQDKVTGQWPLCCTNHITATAGMLKHRIPSFGYVFSEAPKAGKLNSEKLIKFGVPKGPLFGKIKNGEQVTLSDGRRVNPSDFIGPTQPGRKIAILQDTCDSWSMQDACYRCDILIHEATNENSHEEKCVANGHSTPRMAAEFASAVQAQMLIQSHCSQRYKDPKQHAVSEGDATVETLTQEAQLKYDGPVVTAYDGLVMNVKRKIVDT
uniref:Zinc phosphodiesterase ELAC protein 1-like n=1 Tax=Phallusia mammillata TaxID=59560 RepID=A0A6F9DC02_9ASCI|nr:zinc phosphodiesterase ELAC protein 1-like [Phallusia mammillata]